MMSMTTVDVVVEEDGARIVVCGELDAHSFEQIEATLLEAIRGGQPRVSVDLSGVEYISSAGAGVFINARGVAQENNCELALVQPAPCVRELFHVLGLEEIFQFEE